mmetsp:Transcript_853/g.2927  ORF Transcript_853/g.2927 Transcript_853/m.2927 type:complete len:816 (-) Transcript_853:2712-5159(-)
MSRSHPWITKCPEPVKELIQQLASTRLYLVRETGPTSFILTDGDTDDVMASTSTTTTTTRSRSSVTPNKYKVRIGSSHKCSCGSSQTPCIHILYVFCKIFRVPDTNPLIWQLSLIDHEINQILQGRASAAYAARAHGSRRSGAAAKSSSQRRQLDEGDVCPICQEDMGQEDFLIYCHECGQNIHTKCMKIWADHRTKCHEDITCPLCRTTWSQAQVQQLSYVNRKRYITSTAHTGIKCDACSTIPIQGERFKCTICADYNLCSNCFHYKSIHTQHSFDKKENPKEEVWIPVDRVISIERRADVESALSSGGVQGVSHRRHGGGASSRSTHTSRSSSTTGGRSRRRGSSNTQRFNSTRRERLPRRSEAQVHDTLDLAVVSSRHNPPPPTSTNTDVEEQFMCASPLADRAPVLAPAHRRARSSSRGTVRSTRNTQQQQQTLSPSILALMHRDIDENDYDLLLQLDTPKDRGIPKYIFALLPQVHVNEHNHSDFADDSCSICLCNYQISDDLCHLKCMHYYHYACISKWLETHDSCCVCNHQVTAEDYPPPSRIQFTRERTDREVSEQFRDAYSPSPTVRAPPNRPRPRSVVRARPSSVPSSSASSTPTSASNSGAGTDLNFGITGSTWETGRVSTQNKSDLVSTTTNVSGASTPVRTRHKASAHSPSVTNANSGALLQQQGSSARLSGFGIGITGSTVGANSTTASRPLIRSESLRRMKRTTQRKKALDSQNKSTLNDESSGTLQSANEQNFNSMFNVRSTRHGQVQQSSQQERQKVRSIPRVKVGRKLLSGDLQNKDPPSDSSSALSSFSLSGRRI